MRLGSEGNNITILCVSFMWQKLKLKQLWTWIDFITFQSVRSRNLSSFPSKSITSVAGLKVECSSGLIKHHNASNQQEKCRCVYPYLYQSHAEHQAHISPGLSQDCRQGHLPGNLSCSDYTMCLASLWAILPFCSVKYKKHSGKGKGLGKVWLTSLPRLNSLNQEPGFSFAQVVSLAWGYGLTEAEEEEEVEGKTLKKGNTSDRNTESPLCFYLLFFSPCFHWGAFQTWNSVQ